MTDCVIRSRIDSHVKAEAVQLFEHMGLTLSEAIRLFLYQSVAEHRIPFSINIPNAKTRATIGKANKKEDISTTSLGQLSQDWDQACGK